MSGPRRWAAQRATALGSIALGAVVGVELGVVGAFASEWTTAGLWTGALAAGLADLVAGVLLALARRGRRPVVAALVGWLIPVVYLSSGRPEGDVVLRAAPRGYAFLLLGAAGYVPGAWLAVRRPRAASPVPPGSR